MINGKRIEDERGDIFPDDAKALAFGGQVVRELTQGDHGRFTGWTMEVTEGARIVGTIPCALDGLAGREKSG
jgi:hypothetical protein